MLCLSFMQISIKLTSFHCTFQIIWNTDTTHEQKFNEHYHENNKHRKCNISLMSGKFLTMCTRTKYTFKSGKVNLNTLQTEVHLL